MILWSQRILWHKNLAGVIASGSIFMSKPCETLKNWTHWGVMGVINPRHSAGDCQNESHLPPLLRALQYCIFSPGSRCTYSIGAGKVIE